MPDFLAPARPVSSLSRWLLGAAALLGLLGHAASAQAQSSGQGDRLSPWILDVSAGVPRLKNDDVGLIGDATVGYATPSFGLVAKGGVQVFDIEGPVSSLYGLRSGGSGEAWYVTGEPTSAARFEVRAAGGGYVFSSTYQPNQSSAISGYYRDEDSFLARGSLLLGGQFRPDSSLSVGVLLGGGFQLEDYSTISPDPKVNAISSDTTQTSVQAQGRFRLRWAFLPEVLSLRVRASGNYFQLTRDDLIVRAVPAGAALESTQATFKTLDLSTRLFVDIDALSFVGIAPSVFVGLDYLGLTTDAGSASQTAPSVGLGLFKNGD